MKILIVEDNELQRRIIKEFVRDQVDEFVECSDGLGALESYIYHRPDVSNSIEEGAPMLSPAR